MSGSVCRLCLFVSIFFGVATEGSSVLQESRPSVWKKDEDYVRMDGSTGAQSRKRFTTNFNDATNERSTPHFSLLSSFILGPVIAVIDACFQLKFNPLTSTVVIWVQL